VALQHLFKISSVHVSQSGQRDEQLSCVFSRILSSYIEKQNHIFNTSHMLTSSTNLLVIKEGKGRGGKLKLATDTIIVEI
jgi:hypothetical protein